MFCGRLWQPRSKLSRLDWLSYDNVLIQLAANRRVETIFTDRSYINRRDKKHDEKMKCLVHDMIYQV